MTKLAIIKRLICLLLLYLFMHQPVMAQVIQSPQTINLEYNSIYMRLEDSPVTFTATSTSNGKVYLSAAPATVCSFSGDLLTLSSVGNCTVTASVNASMAYQAATSTQVFAISPNPQTITFAAVSGNTYGAAPFAISATSTSGLAVTAFSSATSSICTVSGSTVTLAGAGTCTLDANQAGNATYAAAPQVAMSFNVAQESQSIAFAAVPAKVYGAAPFTISATSSSGLAVSAFTSATTSICTVSGSTVTILAAGTCTIDANQTGNANVSAAPQAATSFAVAQESQAITFAAVSGIAYGAAPFTISATSTSGLAVSAFTSASPSICTVTGSTVTLVAAGTCTIDANQAGNTNFSAAPQAAYSFTVAPEAQTITFAAVSAKVYGAAPFTISATSSSGLAVSAFTSATTPTCTVSGSTVTIAAAGTCTIDANQSGNTNYSAAPQTVYSFAVAQESQAITFAAVPGMTYGAAPFGISATSTSGLAVTAFTSATPSVCTVTGSTVTLAGAGTCTINANQAGNANFSAAPQAADSFTVAPESQTITFAAVPSKAYGAAPFAISATSTSGLTVSAFTSASPSICTVSGSTVTLAAAGACTIDANQSGNTNYSAATQAVYSFVVALESQTITFAAVPSKAYGAAPFAISATSTSGLTVSAFTSASPSICTVSGSTVTIVAVGTCTIDGNQTGNANISAAPQVAYSFTVAPESQTITFVAVPAKAYGAVPFTISATSTSGLPVSAFTSATTSICTVSGSTLTILAAGTCTIDANQAGNANISAAPQAATSFTVAQESQTITFAAVSGIAYGGAPFAISATSTSGLAVAAFTSATPLVCTVSGSTVTLAGAGTCTIDANQTGNANFSAAPLAAYSFNVAPESQAITFAAVPAKAYGAAPFTISATSTSGLTVSAFTSATTSICSVSGSTVTLAAAGTCTIDANQSGNANYSAAPQAAYSFAVALESQTISFSALASQPFGAVPFTVSATSTSALPVAFNSATTSICTVSGSTVTLIAGGLCTINANQSGNTNYSAALQVVNSFMVTVPPGVSMTGPADGATYAAQSQITFTVNTAGTYTISNVSYYSSGGTLIGTATSAPWSYTATSGLAAGSYSIYAVLTTTTTGMTATSAFIAVTVGTGTGAPASSSTPIPVPITPPSLGNFVAGSLPGNLGVSPNGAATYSIPLAIPPGVAGLMPSLTLDYASRNANGFLGMGWSLGGISTIRRCNKTIAQDGVTSGVNFTNTDRLCLDGQRLILVTSPTSGNADADYWAVGATYGTELTNFSRITSYSGTQGLAFKVETKSGRIRYYGDQGDGSSYITAARGPNNGKSNVWALGQEQDLFGNYYTITYANTSATTGEFLPSQIQYGGNNQTGLVAHLSVVFNYVSTRLDGTIRYVAGSHNDMASLLSNIKVYNGLFNSGTATEVREYDMTYTTSTSSGRSMISSIQMQALNPQKNLMVAFPATTFSWGQSAAPQFTETNSDQSFDGPVAPLISGVVTYSNIIWADFNGDGMTDALVVDPRKVVAGTNQPQYYIYLAQKGGGFAPPILWTVPATIASIIAARKAATNTGEWPTTIDNSWGFVGDFDGDGSSDIFLLGGYVCLSQLKTSPTPANAFACTDTGTNTLATSGLGASLVSFDASDYLVMDTTGSGRQDILMRNILPTEGTRCVATTTTGSLGYQCGTYTGTDYAVTGTLNQNPGHVIVGRGFAVNSIGHFSGSGRQDLFRFEVPPSGVGSLYLEVCTSGLTAITCGNWGAMPPTYSNGTAGSTYLDYPAYIQGVSLVADANGDGLADVLLSGTQPASGTGTNAAICYSTGASFDCHELTTAQGTDAVIQHIGPIDSDGSIKTLSYVYDATGESGTWRTCTIQNNSVLSCQSIAGGAPMAWIPYLQPNTLPDPIIQFGGYVNDGTFNMLAYSPSVDASQPAVYSPISTGGTAWRGYTLAPNANLAVDKLVSVINGIGRSSSVTYTQAGQAAVYTQYASAGSAPVFPTYPIQSVPNPGYLVSTLSDSNGQGGFLKSTYQYVAKNIDASGRGSLGFASMVSTNVQNGLSTSTVYNQAWPYSGLVASAQTTATHDGGTVLSTTSNTYATSSLPDAYYSGNAGVGGTETSVCVICFTYISSTTTTKADLNQADLGTTTVNAISYDNFGNLLTSTASSKFATDTTPFLTSTNNTWDNGSGTCIANPGATYVVGKMCSTSISKTNQSGATLTRTSAATYFATGLTQTETLEPTHTTLPSDDLQVMNTYTRDGYGNVLTNVQSWLDPVSASPLSRTSIMTYTSDGRFPASATNAMGQTESYLYDAATGVRTQLTDINGLITTWTVDGLGKVLSQTSPGGNVVNTIVNQCAGDCPSNATLVSVTTYLNNNQQIAAPTLSYADPLGHVIRTMSYGFDGRPIATDHSFDTQARPLADYQPVFVIGPTVGYQSGVIAMQRSVVDNLNRTTESETLDTGGNVLNTITTFSGAVRTVQNPLGETRTKTSDVLGQLVSVATGSLPNTPSTLTSFAYDPFGNLTLTTDPAGNQIAVGYDAIGHKIQLNDPDLGIIQYRVDPVGRTWKQISPNENAAGQTTTFQFDMLDRMISRIEPDLNSHFIYDVTAASGAALTALQITTCQNNLSCGKLVESYTAPAANGNVGVVNNLNNTKETDTVYTYDGLGRPWKSMVTLDPTTFNVFNSETDYDAWSRPITQIYQHGTTGVNLDPPKVFDLRYNNMGYLQSVQRSGLNLWQALTQDAANRVVTAQLANPLGANEGLIATRCYDTNSGRLDETVIAPVTASVPCGTTPAITTVMESYYYDALGNVSQRNEAWNQGITGTVASQSFSEGFTYDGLNRILTSTVTNPTPQPQQAYSYTIDGNLLSNTAAGIYTYTGGISGGPHAVKTVSGAATQFTYDADGNQLTGNSHVNIWTSFDMPLTMGYTGNGAANSSQFTYGPNHERRTQSQGSTAIIYYGGAQEVQTDGSHNITEIKTYWPMGLGVEIDRPAQVGSELDWTHTDQLGSVIAITDSDGNLKEALGYDTWGNRRNALGAPVSIATTLTATVNENTDDKGYTGAEQITSLELVHLNGRLYDPLIGRFISADPHVTNPKNGQNYNRYSYVLNNPLKRTDPTGFDDTGSTTPGTNNTGVGSPNDCFCSIISYNGSEDWGRQSNAVIAQVDANLNGQPGTINQNNSTINGDTTAGIQSDVDATNTVTTTPASTTPLIGSTPLSFTTTPADAWTTVGIPAPVCCVNLANSAGPMVPAADPGLVSLCVLECMVAAPVATVNTIISLTRQTSTDAAAGPYSVYDTSGTWAGGNALNVNTSATSAEAQATLQSNGYSIVRQDVNQNGPFTVLSDGTNTYTFYTRTSTGEAGAATYGSGGTLKISFPF